MAPMETDGAQMLFLCDFVRFLTSRVVVVSRIKSRLQNYKSTWNCAKVGSIPACAVDLFPKSKHTSDLNIGNPVATLPGARR